MYICIRTNGKTLAGLRRHSPLSSTHSSFSLCQVNTAVKHQQRHWRWCISDLTSPVIPLVLLQLQSINCGSVAKHLHCRMVSAGMAWGRPRDSVHTPTAHPESWWPVSTRQMRSCWRFTLSSLADSDFKGSRQATFRTGVWMSAPGAGEQMNAVNLPAITRPLVVSLWCLAMLRGAAAPRPIPRNFTCCLRLWLRRLFFVSCSPCFRRNASHNKPPCIEEASALVALGTFNYLHLGMYSTDILAHMCVIICRRVGGSVVWWKLPGFCGIVRCECQAKWLQSIFEANGLK